MMPAENDQQEGTAMFIRAALFGAAAFALAATGAIATDFVGGAIKTMSTAKGTVLADADGMTLYVFDKDTAGTSNCYDTCAANWPPLAAESGAMASGDFTLITRKDGTTQWAYKGKPLYLWIKDAKPGDTTGDGVGGVWHAATE
jgi:predicted lipoprotein with Yx(FWY)xxD motif